MAATVADTYSIGESSTVRQISTQDAAFPLKGSQDRNCRFSLFFGEDKDRSKSTAIDW